MSKASQAIYQLNETIGSFKSRVDVKVGEVKTSTSNIQVTSDMIYEKISKFKTDMVHGEEKQIAHENILRIDQIIKEQFSNHMAIRKTVMGVVKDFDINLVRNSTITELSEELWITSSRYWLSYALLAITAWVNDYKEVATNALSECSRKDQVKSSLFFCLMNLRFQRNEAAKSWLFEYFKSLDPKQLQQETAVLLQAYLNGIFGNDKELEYEVVKLVKGWLKAINEDESVAEEIENAYLTYIGNINTTSTEEFPHLKQYCTNEKEIEISLNELSKYDHLIEFVDRLDVDAESQSDENYKARVDAVLINLITNYDKEELDLKRQQEYYKFIVENDGQVGKAAEQYEAMLALENEHFHIGKQMIDWAVYDSNDTTDIQVRKFGFQNTKLWFSRAVDAWDTLVHENSPREFSLNIDTWTNVSNGDDQPAQEQHMRDYFEDNKFHNMYVNNFNIVCLIVAITSLGLVFLTPFALIATVVSVGLLVFRALKAKKAYPNRIKDAVENLNKCMDELAEYNRYYVENRSKKSDLISKVDYI